MHAIDGQHFVATRLDDASDVFVQDFFPAWPNEGLSIFGSEDDMNVQLSKAVGHEEGGSLPIAFYPFWRQ